MFSKLAEVEQRYEELTARLQDPVVYGDPERLRRVSRERTGLEEIVRNCGFGAWGYLSE